MDAIFENTEQLCEDAIDLLNEVYFGETDGIKRLQDQISRAREKYVANSKGYDSNVKGLNTDKEIYKIGEVIENVFGFYGCDFKIISSGVINAYTYPITTAIDITPEDTIKACKNGYRYDKKNKYCVMISVTSRTFCNKDITDREVMAIILHEIGHSFIPTTIESINMIKIVRISLLMVLIMQTIQNIIRMNPIGVINSTKLLLNITNVSKVIKHDLNKKIERDNILNKLKGGLGYYKNIIKNIFKEIMFIMTKITGAQFIINVYSGITSGLNGVLNKWTGGNSFERSQERLSDSFASIYGYGADITSILHKMEITKSQSGLKSEEIINSIPIISKIDNLLNYPFYIAMRTFSTHPSFPNRANKIMEELKYELKKSDLSPKIKLEIENNLKELEQFKKRCENVSEISNKDPLKYRKLWIAALLTKNDTGETKYEKIYTDMDKRDEHYQKIYEEQCSLLDNIHLI